MTGLVNGVSGKGKRKMSRNPRLFTRAPTHWFPASETRSPLNRADLEGVRDRN